MKNVVIIVLGILVAASAGYAIKVGLSNKAVTDKTTIEKSVTSVTPTQTQNTPQSSGNKLDLSGQGLTKAPSGIFSQTGLVELDLSNNKIEGSLQAEVRNLQNLKVLNLSNNKFSGVPAEIGQLKNLEILNLSNNLITGLPNELGNLSNLKLLDLSGNNYSAQDLAGIKSKLPASTAIKTN